MAATSVAVNRDFETALGEYTKGRKRVSDGMYSFLRALVYLFTTCAVTMAAFYGMQLGESLLFKVVIVLTAVGIECAVVFFSAVIYPEGVITVAKVLSGVLLPALSLFTVMSFMISQQFAADNSGLEGLRRDVARLEAAAGRLDITKREDRGTIQVTNNRIEEAREKLRRAEAAGEGSKATAIYHYIAKTTGASVEWVILMIRFAWGLCFVCLTVALDAYVDTRLYSPSSLKRWIDAWKEEGRLFDDARAWRPDAPKIEAPRVEEVKEEEDRTPILHYSAPRVRRPVAKADRYRRTEREDGDGLWEEVYQRVRDAVESGEVKPSVAKIKELAKGTDNAYLAIDRLLKDGVIIQGDNGRYQLASA
jgi:hypothetical protein